MISKVVKEKTRQLISVGDLGREDLIVIKLSIGDTIYKLSRMSVEGLTDLWAFCSLESSFQNATGSHSSFKGIIKDAIDKDIEMYKLESILDIKELL